MLLSDSRADRRPKISKTRYRGTYLSLNLLSGVNLLVIGLVYWNYEGYKYGGAGPKS